MKKKVLKVLGMGLSVYFVAFLAFILDLDGKALFYLYEPIVTKPNTSTICREKI